MPLFGSPCKRIARNWMSTEKLLQVLCFDLTPNKIHWSLKQFFRYCAVHRKTLYQGFCKLPLLLIASSVDSSGTFGCYPKLQAFNYFSTGKCVLFIVKRKMSQVELIQCKEKAIERVRRRNWSLLRHYPQKVFFPREMVGKRLTTEPDMNILRLRLNAFGSIHIFWMADVAKQKLKLQGKLLVATLK